MLRKLTVVLGLAMSLLVTQQASAIPVSNLDGLILGAPIAPSLVDEFTVAAPPPPTMGEITNNVFFDPMTSLYTYVHTVTPDLINNLRFNSAGAGAGFTGVAGWSFTEAGAAGGTGTSTDLSIDNIDGQLNWNIEEVMGSKAWWDSSEPITFFFVSTKPPGIGDYNLSAGEVGTAQSYAPVPEPGSIALLGSGIVGLYAAMRRRRSLRA
ncbi:MAG: PEP-CTERM sorting domain-containing protein [Vicinamibacterales bacterium]